MGKRYGNVTAIHDFSFDLQPGEILSILGPSGSGKTTILRLIAGFESVDIGEISIHGQPVSGPSVHVPPDLREVGMVFQEYALFPHKTVDENVSFGLQGLSLNEKHGRTAEVLEFTGMQGLEHRYPHELSGGQQQRVALARTMAPNPVTILLDEPFSNLDASMRRQMRIEVESILRANGIATVFVTHDREEAFAMADRIGVMNNGRLEQLDTPQVIYNTPATPFVAQLGGMCDFIQGVIQDDLAKTEIGNLAYRTRTTSLEVGTEVDLLVHPDDFQIMPHPEGTSVVVSREFRGDETILVVRMPSGATLRCRERSFSVLDPGTNVTLIPGTSSAFLAFPKFVTDPQE